MAKQRPRQLTILSPQSFWDGRHVLSTIARETRSWRAIVDEIRSGKRSGIVGFNGSGFIAKEVLLDSMHTPAQGLSTITDRNEWCPIGPGARRGLNRLHGRPTSFGLSAQPQIEQVGAMRTRLTAPPRSSTVPFQTLATTSATSALYQGDA